MIDRRFVAWLSASLKCGAAASALLLPSHAFAQSTAPEDDQEQVDPADKSEIVVTGTLIRGVAPAGANVIGVTSKAVEETGASSTAQLLQTIPQLGSFNNLQTPIAASTAVTTNRPNLRNLPGFNTSGSSPTLVLVDGHRVVGMGISVTSPDADIIPPGAIERVEIVPDGGSAIYGSDAVAGVINFITKKKYDGIEVGGHFGFADNYKTYDVNATVGKSWDRGSIYVSYNYAAHDDILGRDRDWVFYPDAQIDGVVAPSLRCSPGNVTVGNAFLPQGTPTTTFGLTAAGARMATLNRCDESDLNSIYPDEKRHSVLAGLSQELSDTLKFDVRAFYMNRKLESTAGPFVNSTNFGPGFLAAFGFLSSPIFNANKLATGFLAAGETQTVYYSWGDVDSTRQKIGLETYGIAPSFTFDIGGGWQLRSISSYGESVSTFSQLAFGQPQINNAITEGLFNPYNVASSNPAVLAAINNFENYSRTEQQQFNTRLIVDGDLFPLPGGSVKVAAGLEYNDDTFVARFSKVGNIVRGTAKTGYAGLTVNGAQIIAPYGALPQSKLRRNVKSAFGEIVVPLFGADNAMGGFEELTLSVAGRYDDYSDFGSTFNPKFGVSWKPVDWIKLRGAWGKSFVAPSLADSPQTTTTSTNFVNLSFLLPPANLIGTTVNGVNVPNPAGVGGNRSQVVVLGNKPGISSQKAKTWSLGIDIDPPFVPGLRLSGTYWNIDYSGVIAIPGFTNSTFYQNFVGTPAVIFNPTQAQVDAVIGSADTIAGTSCGGNTATVQTGCYVIIDARKQNLASTKVSGLDFSAYYVTETGFGSVDFAANANYELKRDQQATPTSAFLDQIDANASRFKIRTSLGSQIGGLRAQVTLNHSHGYKLTPPVGVGATQTRVKSFNVVDLFFKYDIAGEGLMSGLSFTLNVNNVLDQDPPVFLRQSIIPSQNGYINGATLGRLVQFGVNKKF